MMTNTSPKIGIDTLDALKLLYTSTTANHGMKHIQLYICSGPQRR